MKTQLEEKGLESAEDYYKEGVDLFKSGRKEAALRCYNKAIELKPDYVEAYLNKAYCLYKLDYNEECISTCDRVIELNPNTSKAYLYKAYGLGDLKRYEHALDCYNECISIAPNEAVGYYQKAEFLYNRYWNYDSRWNGAPQGTRKMAQECYSKAHELNPEYSSDPHHVFGIYNCTILSVYGIEYDNTILNYPVILTSLSYQLNLTQSEVIDRISGYDREFVEQVCLSGNIELFGDLS